MTEEERDSSPNQFEFAASHARASLLKDFFSFLSAHNIKLGMDALALGPFLLEQAGQPAAGADAPWRVPFAPD